ncbi:MAG: 16S rRNA (guanine(966)-N(2))-methyltransferase RsmD [Bacteroidales bacterium]|jgi:16S rRNA (guanine(966)-N(2))-methyltransferase RsmD|nr:16S rRNA (guanine(966)-N(2))-methyltransferase RsmD [Bacteroidales bacterium]MCR4932308.1 16S rRNA (guanine(966)-N(2))-methyltransferase RsmD [Bacteroidales bacterium]
MRIIAGSLRGRRLNPPANLPVRPTTDMARESLFNILNNYVDYEEVTVMDLFAGTGAVSFEFVSRGAKDVTSIDINNACTEYIKSAARQMNISNIRVVRADVFDLLKRAYKKFDLIFADPPYALQDLPNLPDIVFQSDVLTEDGVFILEHPKEYSFEDHPHFWQHRAYGKVNFTFFANKLDE